MDNWELRPARDLKLPRRERHRSTLREIGLVEATGRWVWWSVVRAYLRVFHRLSIHGREHLPDQPPYVIVANHESHLDALCVGAGLRMKDGERIFPLAAGDLFFENPAAAAFSALAVNALPIWRKKVGKRGLLELKARLTEDQSIYILFPEGTRRRGPEMGGFKAGVGMFVASTDVPVVPCWIRGSYEAFPPGAWCPRPRKISLYLGPPQEFSNVESTRSGYKEVAKCLEAAVRQLAAEHE